MVRFGEPPFLECSSAGDVRFSAFHAKVNGRSIEEQYQAAKVFEDGSTGLGWRQAKGRKPVNHFQVLVLYDTLWVQYLREHPELIEVINCYEGFTDKFGRPGGACQAEVLWRIRRGVLKL